jgi:hypothetical protein
LIRLLTQPIKSHVKHTKYEKTDLKTKSRFETCKLNGNSENEEISDSETQETKRKSNRRSDSREPTIAKSQVSKYKVLSLPAIFMNWPNVIFEDDKRKAEKGRPERR